MSRQKAFTLFEILTVCAIIGILSGLVLLIAGPGIAKSKTQPGCEAHLRQVAVAYNLYMADNDSKLPTRSLTDRWGTTYEPQLANLARCPLTHGVYWDAIYMAIGDKDSVAYADKFPNGKPIPVFDSEKDVLYRCLDHAFGGFSRGDTPGKFRFVYNSVGTVLGVRLNGTVEKVAPDSCWEFRYNELGTMRYSNLWGHCDNPG